MEGEIMSTSSERGITSVAPAQEKGGQAPATAGQPDLPEAPAGTGPQGGDGGEPGTDSAAPAPSESLAELLGRKVEAPAPEAGPKPLTLEDLKPLIEERDQLRAQIQAQQERRGAKDAIEKLVGTLDETVYDRDEVRSQLEMAAPVMRALMEEMAAPLVQEIEALKQDLQGERSRRTAAALAQGRIEVEGYVKQLGADTGSGIEMFIGPELNQMVAQVARELGIQAGGPGDTDTGYKRIVAMINSELIAAKATRAKAASARRDSAEARTAPGGRSPLPPKGRPTIEDLRGKSIAEQRRILTGRG